MEDNETDSNSFENAEQDEQGRQTLEAFKHFFETDVKIKEAIADIAPDAADLYDESSRMRYLDRAAREFSDFQPDFQAMISEFQLGENVADDSEFEKIVWKWLLFENRIEGRDLEPIVPALS